MSYRLKMEESIEEGLRRIAHEQINKAKRELTDESLDHGEAVHQFRKRCKKLRGLLRLFRSSLGNIYKQENACFRDAARKVSEIRDAQVFLETLQAIQEHNPEQMEGLHTDGIHEELLQNLNNLTERDTDLNETLSGFLKLLEESHQRVDSWQLSHHSFAAIRGGLKTTYRRAFRGCHDAFKDSSIEQLHEWRKRIKYHWYHLRLLRNIWKPVLKARIGELDRLASVMGLDHDLAEFRLFLLNNSKLPDDPKSLETLLGITQNHRMQLQSQFFKIGQKMFAEKPKCLITRLEASWNIEHPAS